MKVIVSVALVMMGLSIRAVEPQSLKHFVAVPPQARLHFTNFCLGNYNKLFANNELGITQLATTPGLTPALIELADLYESAQEWDGFSRTWGLIARRTDATQIEQNMVRLRLNRLLNKNSDPGGSSFKLSALAFLGNYQSAQNENLLIQYLGDTNGGPLHSDSTDVAAHSLGKIGTSTSIKALKVYAEKRKPPPGGKSRYYEAAVNAVHEIEQRVLSESPTNFATPNKERWSETCVAPETRPTPPPPSAEESTTWTIVATVAAAATALLILLLKKRH